MSSSGYQVRRAVVDDLGALRALWEALRLSPDDLEKRLIEFQVAVAGDGRLLGALALEINGRHGRIHSEVFSDFALADNLRHLLWERMQSLAANHGLVRLWTRESAPFWRQNGFGPPDEAALKKLPAAWATDPAPLVTLKLRDEAALEISLDKEFAKFKQEEQRRREKFLAPGRAIKVIVTVLAIILAITVCVFSIKALLNQLTPPGH